MVAAELVRLVKRMVAAATVAARRCTPVPVAAFSTSESVKLTLGWKKRTPKGAAKNDNNKNKTVARPWATRCRQLLVRTTRNPCPGVEASPPNPRM